MTWQLRACNDTPEPVGKFYFNGDEEHPGTMAPGACTEYVESAPAEFVRQLGAWAGSEILDEKVKHLPFGFHSFHLGAESSFKHVQDHPAVLIRVCNRTHRAITSLWLSLDPITIEKSLAPDECTAYRLPVPRGNGSAVIGLVDNAPTRYAISPSDAAPTTGAWTYDLEIADANQHLLRLHRHTAAD